MAESAGNGSGTGTGGNGGTGGTGNGQNGQGTGYNGYNASTDTDGTTYSTNQANESVTSPDGPMGTPQGAYGNNGLTNQKGKSNYNIKGVDENGLTMKGEVGDRNGDGRISFGEAVANNFSNLGYKANTFFGGADNQGLTRAGRTADRNGDGKVSVGERIGNMFNNMGTNFNMTFGGVNYQGKNKSGEQVVAPGEHVDFGQRITNIGHNIASRNGQTWNDANNNGVMDSGEVSKALAGRMATGLMNLAPVFGPLMSRTVSKAIQSSDGSGVAGDTTGASSYTGPGSLEHKVEAPANATNEIRSFMKKAKKIDVSDIPVTSAYLKRGEEKAPSVTVSDEELKSFAKRWYYGE